ncbi:MAG: hypothetical protein ACM3SQ_07055 [Betaproteobacteria bacterium]
MTRTALVLLLPLAVAAATGCTRRSPSSAPPATAAPGSAPTPSPTQAQAPAAGVAGMGGMADMSGMAHSHIPKYGGTVLMNGNLHFEVVLHRDGKYHVYFSDASQSDLPASMASNVTITVTRKGGAPETVPLRIDEAGESWVGQGKPVPDPDAVARIGYTFQGMPPYWIDLPFSVQDPKMPPAK